MKYRVRVSFQYWKDESQVEAQMLMGYAKGLASRAPIEIGEGLPPIAIGERVDPD